MKTRFPHSTLASLTRPFVFAAALLVCASLHAQTTFYSNLTTFTGQAYSPQASGATGSGTFITPLVADDLNLIAAGAGAAVTRFQFTVANFNATTVSARPIVNFYANNGSGGGPGALLFSVTFNAVTLTGSSVSSFTFAPGGTLFTVPANAALWAGMMFDNGGTSTATQAQLNNFGQGIFNPPTIGSSADVFFRSTANGPTGSNPAGAFQNFGGNPPANFGWSVAGTAAPAVPETGSTILLLALAVGGVAVAQRRMERSAS
ncbi:MAG: hypothetical protein ACJ8HQ_00560 [Chthoniobacterales bacterium]